MEDVVSLLGFIEHDIEHDQPRAGLEKAVEQEPPHFAGPWISVLAHELKRPII